MSTPRISASSYSNTAPLIWSFLYGSQHGRVELVLDNAPARSAQLLGERRVDAALVPVIAYHELEDVRLVPGVCVGAREQVRSVCLVTRGKDLADVRSVALDVSSRTSTVLTKIIFREFLGFEPEWRPAEPDIEAMLETSDCALVIGDPALSLSAECGVRNAERRNAERGTRNAEFDSSANRENAESNERADGSGRADSAFRVPRSALTKFDLAELWRHHTGLGFVFAMWMTRSETSPVDFAAARDEGLAHLDDIVSNYFVDIGMSRDELLKYLSENISYVVDDSLQAGMELYFTLAAKCGLIETVRSIDYLE